MATIHDASFYCICGNELPDGYRDTYIYSSLVFGCLGLLGALAQLLCLRTTYRERRASLTTSTSASDVSSRVDSMVLLCLALANLVACSAVITRSAMMTSIELATCSGSGRQVAFAARTPHVTRAGAIVGLAVECLATFGYAASAAWMLAYAADVWYKLRSTDRRNAVFSTTKLRIVYLSVGWGTPILTTALSTVSVTVGVDITKQCASFTGTMLHYIAAYVIIAIVVAFTPVFYCYATRLSKKVMNMAGKRTYSDRQVFRLLKLKFILIVFICVICWLPNFVECTLQLTVDTSYSDSRSKASWLFPLWVVEAVMNPSQGLFNLLMHGHVNRFLFRFFQPRRYPASADETQPLIRSQSVSL